MRAERPLFCAVTKAGKVTGQPLSDKAVARLVKQAALDAGLDPERYSGHSLRAGLATAAGDAGAGLAELMRQTQIRRRRPRLSPPTSGATTSPRRSFGNIATGDTGLVSSSFLVSESFRLTVG